MAAELQCTTLDFMAVSPQSTEWPPTPEHFSYDQDHWHNAIAATQPFGPQEPVIMSESVQPPFHSGEDVQGDHMYSYYGYDLRSQNPGVLPESTQPPLNPYAFTRPQSPYDRQPVPIAVSLLSVARSASSACNKPKPAKISVACDACRVAKAKCDEPNPCTSCLEKGIECLRKSVEPKRGEKVDEDVVNTLRILVERINALESRFAPLIYQNAEFMRVNRHPAHAADLVSVGEDDEKAMDTDFFELFGSGSESPDPLFSQDEEDRGMALLPDEKLSLWPVVASVIHEMQHKHSDMHTSHDLPGSGQRGAHTPIRHFSCLREPNKQRGGPGPNKQLNLDEGTMQQLIDNYLKHFHPIYTMLDVGELRDGARNFVGRDAGITPQRPIEKAILLLVFALGEICNFVPNAIPNHKSIHSGAPSQSGYPSPILTSPVVSFQSSGSLSPLGVSQSRQQQSAVKHLDMIPGQAFAVLAIKMLRKEIGNKTLLHAQAYILASLYFSQLARPSWSYLYIGLASSTLQLILQPKLRYLKQYILSPENPSPEMVHAEENPLTFTSWTCKQLERDIVAELHLQLSGIDKLEIPWPNLKAAMAAGMLTPKQADSYQAQLCLENYLNTIQQEVYDKNLSLTNTQSRFPVIEAMVDSISRMSEAAPSMAWSETDPRPTDILTARLRTKYYGLKMIAYLPVLKMVINRNSLQEDFPSQVMVYSKLCIQAMLDSTIAFYGIEDGQIIFTSDWRTAHAQYDNLILLQAAYQDPLLRPFINKDTLRILSLKTLSFLQTVAKQVSSLNLKIRILEYLTWKMDILPEYSSSSS